MSERMKIGVTLRNMGMEATAETLLACAQAADAAGFESLWITDHIAIPPDDAEGSEGLYTDTLTTLAWLAGVTHQIKLGSGVLILPYRPLLPTAKQIATVQALSAERLLLGVGVGWMDAEFRALGVPRHRRGQLSDEMLAFLHQCFSQDEVQLNGQPFLFKPRPARPPILVGGAAPHALHRAVRFGDGWLPMARSAVQLAAAINTYRELCATAGRAPGNVTAMARIAQNDATAARDDIAAYAEVGVDRLVCAMQYRTSTDYRRCLEFLLAATA